MQAIRVEKQLGAHTLILETGKLAKQAHGAVIVRYADTMTLSTAVEGSAESTKDYFPLVVDYREKTYAAGKFPGGFMKREGRPTTKEILTSRLIDRPIRPLFPADYMREVQIMASTLSCDRDFDPDVLAMIGASAALHISQIPFLQPTGSIRIAKVAGELIVFPTYAQVLESDLDLIVAGTKDAITMIEGFAKEIPEDQVYEGIMFAHEQIKIIVDLIHDLRKLVTRGELFFQRHLVGILFRHGGVGIRHLIRNAVRITAAIVWHHIGKIVATHQIRFYDNVFVRGYLVRVALGV